MRITVGEADFEVASGTPLSEVLEAAGDLASRWCGGTMLDLAHRAGRAPLLDGAVLDTRAAACSVPPRGASLEVVAGPDAGACFEVLVATSVGREGTIALADPSLSARHLEVTPEGRVRDLRSANGTRVIRERGRPARRRRAVRLHDGDLIEAGTSTLRWRDGSVPPHPAGAGAREKAPGPDATAPSRGTLTAGSLGAVMGGVGIGVATGRWLLAAALALAPLVALAVGWGWRRLRTAHQPEPPPPGMLALDGLATPLAIRGEPEATLGAARALALVSGAVPACLASEPWTRRLPLRLTPDAVRLVPPGQDPPTDVAVVLDVDTGVLTVTGTTRTWRPAVVSAGTAALAARRLHRAHDALTTSVRWADLQPDATHPQPEPPAGPRRLEVTLGVGEAGTALLDLDLDGPHLVVAGTTGSGKSMLLETLVSALAWAHSPADLAVALIDFKAGAGLRQCMALPHVCGTLTDLDPHLARRALAGLAAEIGVRKRQLAQTGHDSWHAWETLGNAPPRLLVVIDEFQEVASTDRGFVSEATRLAAQGRALGVHLVLATQRPAGAVTADIRANVASFLALRVASTAESHDLVGDASAAALPADAPGRAILCGPRGTLLLQTALPIATTRPRVHRVDTPPPEGERLATAAARRWRQAPRPTPMWLPPLPARIETAPGQALMLDLPHAREQHRLAWDPASGPCVVLGPRGSGRTTALRTLAATLPRGARPLWLPVDPREAARTLAQAPAIPHAVLLIDDAPLAVDRLAEAEALPGELQLERVARQMPVALAAAPGWSARWSSRAALRVLLTGLDATERTLWGAPPAVQPPHSHPGSAVCGTADGWFPAQVCLPRALTADDAGAPPALIAPLTLPAALPERAIGVGGDRAQPLLAPGVATVVGEPGPELARAVRVLGEHGTVVTERPDALVRDPAAWTVITQPTREALRRWGITVEPGLVDPHPPPGRVLILVGRQMLAAQLRP